MKTNLLDFFAVHRSNPNSSPEPPGYLKVTPAGLLLTYRQLVALLASASIPAGLRSVSTPTTKASETAQHHVLKHRLTRPILLSSYRLLSFIMDSP